VDCRETSPGETTGSGPRAWARDLLESDRRYFEAGAELFPVPGAVIAALRGAESLAAGCVVQRIDAAQAASDADAWLAGVEGRLHALRSPRARVYLDTPHAPLERALERRGYRPRVEFGFVRAAGGGPGGIEIELLPAEDEHGWSARRALMHRAGRGPDGHSMEPELWVAMERRKSRAGYMRPYLIRTGGEIVGAVCAAPCGSLLRMKNLIVDPGHRRRGVATATAVHFARLAEGKGFTATGCFALDGEPGLVVYPRAGYMLLARQTEWVRDLEATAVP
jgi:ribosomal protein S18 acetylase RimI-like enzyme